MLLLGRDSRVVIGAFRFGRGLGTVMAVVVAVVY
jgi:hypothetical protein